MVSFLYVSSVAVYFSMTTVRCESSEAWLSRFWKLAYSAVDFARHLFCSVAEPCDGNQIGIFMRCELSGYPGALVEA